MATAYQTAHGEYGAPAFSAFTITPSDATDFTYRTRGIYVGGTGDVQVVFEDGESVLFGSVPAGVILPVQAKRVDSTGTTATLLVGLL